MPPRAPGAPASSGPPARSPPRPPPWGVWPVRCPRTEGPSRSGLVPRAGPPRPSRASRPRSPSKPRRGPVGWTGGMAPKSSRRSACLGLGSRPRAERLREPS
eukprot:190384-Pyramimonas_sp.AAC.1